MPAQKRQQSWSGIIERLLRQGHRHGPAGANGDGSALPDPRVLGLRMAALYCYWQRTNGPDLPRLTGALIEHIGLGQDTPIACTCQKAAAAVSRWRGRAYHSARHHAEVATNAVVLAAIAARHGDAAPPSDLGILLAAALAHDIHWEPREQVRFAMEAKSAAVLDAIAAECGVATDDRQAMRALVLATEPHSRAELAAPGRRVPAPDPMPEALAALLREPRLVRLAALLSDADLLSSAGLTLAWTKVQGQRLAREIKAPLGEAEHRYFFEQIVGPRFLSPGGAYFAANLARIRAWRPSGRRPSGASPPA